MNSIKTKNYIFKRKEMESFQKFFFHFIDFQKEMSSFL